MPTLPNVYYGITVGNSNIQWLKFGEHFSELSSTAYSCEMFTYCMYFNVNMYIAKAKQIRPHRV